MEGKDWLTQLKRAAPHLEAWRREQVQAIAYRLRSAMRDAEVRPLPALDDIEAMVLALLRMADDAAWQEAIADAVVAGALKEKKHGKSKPL